jgi:hypothetical protein
MKAFEGETKVWTRCFLAALAGCGAHGAVEIADAAEEFLKKREKERAQQASAARAQERDAAIAKVKRIGRYVDGEGSVFTVGEIKGRTAVVLHQEGAERRLTIDVYDLACGNCGLTPAPESEGETRS